MQYDPGEIRASEKQLEEIFQKLEEPICLLGGWAVYHIVNNNFEKANGRSYIGSRDIDIGFHIEPNWTEPQLQNSNFASAINTLELLGFRSISFRLVKDFDTDTGRELTTIESAKLPLYQIFQLFVDPIVDFIHPKIKELLGFVPIDEPLLSHLFQNKRYTVTALYDRKVMLPKPEVLLAMKLNSVLNRDKEHKRIKDIADIYALLWYSDTPLPELKNQLSAIHSEKQTKETVRTFSEENINEVSRAIGVNSKEISRVLMELT
jgi:hypothetical protein